MGTLHLGQLASQEERFCPLAAVSKYPYRYLSRNPEAQTRVVEQFWNGGKFNGRGWDVFYVRTLLDSGPASLLLIPKTEVEAFFHEVKFNTGVDLPFPGVTTTPGFDIGFHEKGEPRPRYLARLTSDITIADLKNSVPTEGMPIEEPLDLDERTFPAFREKLKCAVAIGSNSTQAQKDKRNRERILRKIRWCAQLKRTKRYLGLQPQVTAKLQDFRANTSATWQAADGVKEVASAVDFPPLDINKSAPYRFNLNVILICIDIEAYERDSSKVTEIGISTLDTLDIIKTPPGDNGTEWAKYMRCRHFRVAEYAHLVNKDFVSGCPNHFRKIFGTSEWISVNEVAQVVAACFQAPYSAPGQYVAYPSKLQDCPSNGSGIQPMVNSKKSPQRNIILVGHNILSDITYLRSIGLDVGDLDNVLEAIDTVDIWRAWKHEQQGPKLADVLYELGMEGWHLHNAGNDAAYTLQALIGMNLAALNPPKRALASNPGMLFDDASLKAGQRAADEDAEWTHAEVESGDGGNAISISDLEFDLSMSKGRKADEKASKRREEGAQRLPHPHATAVQNHGQRAPRQENTKGKPALPVPTALLHRVSNSTSLPSTAPETNPKIQGQSLSQQMEKRLVIMDNEDYGM